MRKKKRVTDGVGSEWTSAPRAGITPDDVQQKEFRVARFGGGYRMREVDEFLDQVTDALSALIAENERLLAGVSPVDAVAPRPATPDDRAAVDAFLRREKGFLQSLGGLVQEHAEELKGMVRAARRQTAAPEQPVAPEHPAAPAEVPLAVGAAAEIPGAEDEAPSDEDADERGATATTGAEPETTPEAPTQEMEDGSQPSEAEPDEEPIRLEQPEPARSGRPEDGSEGSLRELFWGEE
jgi:DivIVA domain-containing protein